MKREPIYDLIRNQKKEGLKQLYEQYGKKLFGYGVHSWKLSEDEAWELVYQTLFKVCEKIEKYSFKDEKSFASFIFTIFINLITNHLRDKKEIISLSLDEIPELSSGNVEMQKDSENLLQLKEELSKLEDWERVLLLLRCQDMPYTEISKYTGKTPDTLKVYYGRLKEKLGKKLNVQNFKDELK